MVEINIWTKEKEDIKEKYKKAIHILGNLKGKFLYIDIFGLIYWNNEMCFLILIRKFFIDIEMIEEIERDDYLDEND